MDNKKIAIQYFEAVEARSHEKIMELFDENCEVFFAAFGIAKGWDAFEQVNKQLVQYFKQLFFRKEAFIFTVEKNRIVVEGTEYGQLSEGQTIENNHFCNVFEINEENGLIQRMYAYTDPNLGLNVN
ncbi:nuclear transport factor 2 family protein [Tetragenococcus halophilus]|uniref:SnoaL-like domain-containing protein n=1 Tax=Tetragenococcus halophilus (strain DSM 20338 / JCM 20259 / NCIMB 9735 / NBRC 12172) TaxID=945021 RepID=A0AAN1VQU6_TETHN|nr:nuclear transport factor 2 family protein [Tetragenococcus halophilus]NWO01263.1 nuclear transport factor 2 family protein [Tetragenococcus halophilus]QXN86121.1 nuclear transport factor 2 family protein [Tetragenococcus halophilus]WJS81205.1 nuclear transport factor 2 family protein [Tetragenococcus halophilus]BAK94399.1 hypothetical protein TEH_10720 [Tetragenococcus halophilus NBRC 12172]GBD62057.1 putative uncharacterized protein [Tetragenococcus halophilus subsp. halophilus]